MSHAAPTTRREKNNPPSRTYIPTTTVMKAQVVPTEVRRNSSTGVMKILAVRPAPRYKPSIPNVNTQRKSAGHNLKYRG
jgi:hypothetical protein